MMLSKPWFCIGKWICGNLHRPNSYNGEISSLARISKVTILKLYIYPSDETPHLLEVQLGLQAAKLKANIRDKAKGWLWSQWKPRFYTHARTHIHTYSNLNCMRILTLNIFGLNLFSALKQTMPFFLFETQVVNSILLVISKTIQSFKLHHNKWDWYAQILYSALTYLDRKPFTAHNANIFPI
jgi:hypothetical protein